VGVNRVTAAPRVLRPAAGVHAKVLPAEVPSVAEARLPLASRTERVTVLTPMLVQVKLAGDTVRVLRSRPQLSLEPLSMSAAVIVKAPFWRERVRFRATTTGGVTSCGVTVKEAVAVLPDASVAVKDTVTGSVPDKAVPGAGLCVNVMASAGETSSVTVAKPR
jgi:hypothetical protein